MIVTGGDRISEPSNHLIFFTLFIILVTITLILITILARQPQNKLSKTFQMPFVPIFPLLSAFVNFYLIMVLPVATWIRFGVWLAFGFVIYFSYGIRNSSENPNYKLKKRLEFEKKSSDVL
jgi:hypothetical protein